ncbi:MAG: DNA-3-methyladenine glycosylase 2 family protein [Lachnospiraceae bacterium]|nr:DNA-3-methyladenine glycosylase 2 family protein [Lachnospiraceae bacterium]
MNIYSENKNIIINELSDFDIEEVLECGQCFHFTKLGESNYELLAFGKYLNVTQHGTKLIMHNTSMEEFDSCWKQYFDLDRDYFSIKSNILKLDSRLKEAVESKPGIRILRQEFFETLISFIISQNKQIPHIKQIVHTISERFGSEIVLEEGRKVYAFPTVEQLSKVTEDELRECKVGFRAPYIKCAVSMVASGEITEEKLLSMTVGDAREKLMTIKGVGEKVANCVLLFGLGFTDTFPIDVWMKRIMEYMYYDKPQDKKVIEAFAMEKYGDLAGYAQQYLFFYGRENGLGK